VGNFDQNYNKVLAGNRSLSIGVYLYMVSVVTFVFEELLTRVNFIFRYRTNICYVQHANPCYKTILTINTL